MALTDTKCRSAKPSTTVRKLPDGGGLQFWVQPNGARLWRLAYRFNGKQKLLALGAYPTISLADARTDRDKAKQLLAKGMDPSEAKKSAKAEKAESGNTLRAIAEDFMALQERSGRAPATLVKLQWLLDLAYPALGNKRITDIRPADVLDVLRKTEVRGRYDTAHRLRATIGAVFRFAIATGRAESDPTFSLRGALASPRKKHRAAIIDPKAYGALLRVIDGFDGQPTTLAALKLMALLFPRPGELRAAEWREFDLDAALWTIPAPRTKMRRDHKVPLSRQALVVLQSLRSITGNGRLLFPSIRTIKKPISENTMNAALRRLGYGSEEMCAHGFRSSASTLLNEAGNWHPDAIERQLAHIERNEVRRAYARGQHWDERVRMMQWWADYIDDLKTVGNIVPIGSRGHLSVL